VKINPTGKMDDENVGYFHSGNQIFPSTTDLLETLEKGRLTLDLE
jgi:hypothetical protein